MCRRPRSAHATPRRCRHRPLTIHHRLKNYWTVPSSGVENGKIRSVRPLEASSAKNRLRRSAAWSVQVLRINPRLASVEILCVGDDALPDPCSGLIRREDVRPIDASAPVEVYRSFRPGDIVLARVLSLGDARAYYLSTSEVALGVVLARSSEGAVLRPVSHCLMECPKTKNREPRKVAKPAAPPPKEPETAET